METMGLSTQLPRDPLRLPWALRLLMGVSVSDEMAGAGPLLTWKQVGHTWIVLPELLDWGHTCHHLKLLLSVSLGPCWNSFVYVAHQLPEKFYWLGRVESKIRPGRRKKSKEKAVSAPLNKPCMPNFTLILSLWQLLPFIYTRFEKQEGKFCSARLRWLAWFLRDDITGLSEKDIITLVLTTW